MGSLPRDRVIPARVFEKVGMGYCGPFEIKQSSKRNCVISKGYVVLFVYFTSKAVHIEVISGLSSHIFTAAFKRFISRRVIPPDVYCDNATNFIGATNQLKALYNIHCNHEIHNRVNNLAL